MFLSNPRYFLPSAKDVDFIEDELLSKHPKAIRSLTTTHIVEVDLLNKSFEEFKVDVDTLNNYLATAGEELETQDAEFAQHHAEELEKYREEHSKEIDQLKKALQLTKEEFKVHEE